MVAEIEIIVRRMCWAIRSLCVRGIGLGVRIVNKNVVFWMRWLCEGTNELIKGLILLIFIELIIANICLASEKLKLVPNQIKIW